MTHVLCVVIIIKRIINNKIIHLDVGLLVSVEPHGWNRDNKGKEGRPLFSLYFFFLAGRVLLLLLLLITHLLS